MGLMTQKDMAQQGAGQINAFLEESKLNKAQAKKDEEDRIFAQNHPDPTKEEEGLVDPLAMFTPLASDVVDFDNAVGSAVSGDWEDAVWSAAAAIPLVGTPIVKALKPKKTVKAYKLFRTDPNKPGELFPLFVNAKQSVKQGEWVDAEIGPSSGKKVKSKIGDLAMRPGWHSGDLPVATHIGGKTSKGLSAPDYRPDNQVWAEVEMPDDVDWQSIATSRADKKKNGDIIARTAHITDQLPTGGHYRYKTNTNMTGNWIIGGSMKVNKVLSDVEVKKINDAAGVSDLPRVGSKVPKFNKGGLVDAEMATLNFSHGGSVHGKVGASNVGADMLAKLIAQNKKGDFKRGDAREVMQAPQSTPVDDRPALDAAVIKMVADHKRKQVVQAEEVPQSPQYSFDASLSSAADQAVDKLSVAIPSLGAIGESLLESGIDAGTDLASNVGDFLVGTYQDYKQRDLNTRTRLGSTYDDEMAGMDLVKKEVEKVKPTTTFEADGFEHTLAAEGDKHHVDGGGVLTMSYGIVPDINSISLNGDPINPRTGHTFKVGSDLSKIDFSNATKTVRDVVIKRGDYTTDKEFANAVYTTMATKTKSNLESNKGFKSKWADLPREAKIALVDLDFNTGVGKATPTTAEEKGGSHWSDTALMATEMVKPLEDRSTANLIKFTQNFLDNGESPRGLLRRRLNAYNLVSKVEDKAVYTKQHKEVVADGVYKGKYRHDVFRADGTIIVSWYKVKSPATKADESVQRVVDGELFNELPVSPKPKQAAVDKTDWNRMIS